MLTASVRPSQAGSGSRPAALRSRLPFLAAVEIALHRDPGEDDPCIRPSCVQIPTCVFPSPQQVTITAGWPQPNRIAGRSTRVLGRDLRVCGRRARQAECRGVGGCRSDDRRWDWVGLVGRCRIGWWQRVWPWYRRLGGRREWCLGRHDGYMPWFRLGQTPARHARTGGRPVRRGVGRARRARHRDALLERDSAKLGQKG